MPQAGRTFEEGRIYHVYNRVGGGWMAFDDEGLGERFIEIFRHVVDRDEATSFGWCLPGVNYICAVTTIRNVHRKKRKIVVEGG